MAEDSRPSHALGRFRGGLCTKIPLLTIPPEALVEWVPDIRLLVHLDTAEKRAASLENRSWTGENCGVQLDDYDDRCFKGGSSSTRRRAVAEILGCAMVRRAT